MQEYIIREGDNPVASINNLLGSTMSKAGHV